MKIYTISIAGIMIIVTALYIRGNFLLTVGGCYLTSACVTARGLADDCCELQTLRHFRDTYLLLQKDGQQEVDDYYKVAPQIVAAIMQNENPMIELDMIYSELVWPCVKFIEQGEYDQAYLLYKNTTRALESKYIVKGE